MIVDGERDGNEKMKIKTRNEGPTDENDASKWSMLMRSLKLAGLRRGCMANKVGRESGVRGKGEESV